MCCGVFDLVKHGSSTHATTTDEFGYFSVISTSPADINCGIGCFSVPSTLIIRTRSAECIKTAHKFQESVDVYQKRINCVYKVHMPKICT